ncbi:hypothetical protein [Mongoliimonas terrestris]|uniref:hypothetical protein n=1 Tax=Mongoliimonas terrestris TaxID=1709001 RepID=UPI000A5F9D2E|nr:hypothetical protein [Mongoliimonas terrestris]
MEILENPFVLAGLLVVVIMLTRLMTVIQVQFVWLDLDWLFDDSDGDGDGGGDGGD